ncbi:hypothetical protein Taro_047817 [Colocasia esculenta]|uniref:Retrotransposon gag domain-containing protein n=1 Tax=Colocasia esculenta TaxID=4460 RepID=A0A843WWG0_COLES|nr:hypothetical protein [Colocasia esculenta]
MQQSEQKSDQEIVLDQSKEPETQPNQQNSEEQPPEEKKDLEPEAQLALVVVEPAMEHQQQSMLEEQSVAVGAAEVSQPRQCAVHPKEYSRVSTCTSAKVIWDKLELIYEERSLMARSLAVKILSWWQTMLPLTPLNGQTLPLSSSRQNRKLRGGAPAREGEQRREEQAEQQVPAPQGPVLPPPPPVDYGVFMQGLVQAMQTQAHTQAALQAQLEAQERADVWWASLLRTRFEDGAIDVAWDEFVRLFRAKFIPEHIQDRMEQKFLSLTQGSMTVLEYKAKFAELSKYAPHIVTDERRKAKKCVMGLKPSLRMRLVAFDHRTLDEALSAACTKEGEMEQYLEEKKASQKRHGAMFQWQDKKKAVYQAPQRPVTTSSAQVPSLRSPGVKKECPHCGKTHDGSPARSASPSNGSSSSASYRKTRKASSPSSSIQQFKASSGDLLHLEGSLDEGEGFPNLGLAAASTKNLREGCGGDFLALPKESFNRRFDPFRDFVKGKQELDGKIPYHQDPQLAADDAAVNTSKRSDIAVKFFKIEQ